MFVKYAEPGEGARAGWSTAVNCQCGLRYGFDCLLPFSGVVEGVLEGQGSMNMFRSDRR